MHRFWHLSATLLFAASLRVTAANGYLPAIGPAPLRFVPHPVAPTEPTPDLLALNPTSPTPKAANRVADSTVAAASKTVPTPSEVLGPPAPVAPVPTRSTTASPAFQPLQQPTLPSDPDPAGPTHVVQTIMPQPQLFLQYFTPDYIAGSNGSGYHVVLPMGFLPPQPPRTPSSTATYQVTTPDKP